MGGVLNWGRTDHHRGGSPSVPTWLAGSTVGQWIEVSNSNLSTSGAAWTGTSPGGSGNYSNIVDDWGGAVINTVGFYTGETWVNGPALILWGGGHGGYAGNEVYALALSPDSPAWYRLRDPTVPGIQNTGEDGSGNPVSRHTYDTLVYLGGTTNKMLSMGGLFWYDNASSTSFLHTFNFNQASPNSNQPWGKLTSVGGSPGMSTAYDSTTGLIWYEPYATTEVAYYNIATDTHSSAAFKTHLEGAEMGSDIDTSRGLWFSWRGGKMQGYRLNNGTSNDYYEVSTTGTAPASTASILYDSDADVFRAWNGGKTLYTLTPPGTNPYAGGNSWTWSSATPASGATPTAANARGTWGRFSRVHIGDIRGYIGLNATNESAYFYRTA